MAVQSDFNDKIIVHLHNVLIQNHLNFFEPLLDNISIINNNKFS